MSWLPTSTRALIATVRSHGDTACICMVKPNHQQREHPAHSGVFSRLPNPRQPAAGRPTRGPRCGRLTSLARKTYDEGMSEFITDTNEFTLNGVTYIATPVRTALGTHRGRFMIRCNGEAIGEIREERVGGVAGTLYGSRRVGEGEWKSGHCTAAAALINGLLK